MTHGATEPAAPQWHQSRSIVNANYARTHVTLTQRYVTNIYPCVHLTNAEQRDATDPPRFQRHIVNPPYIKVVSYPASVYQSLGGGGGKRPGGYIKPMFLVCYGNVGNDEGWDAFTLL